MKAVGTRCTTHHRVYTLYYAVRNYQGIYDNRYQPLPPPTTPYLEGE